MATCQTRYHRCMTSEICRKAHAIEESWGFWRSLKNSSKLPKRAQPDEEIANHPIKKPGWQSHPNIIQVLDEFGGIERCLERCLIEKIYNISKRSREVRPSFARFAGLRSAPLILRFRFSELTKLMAELTGLEPATSRVTGERSNQLNYNSAILITIILITMLSCPTLPNLTTRVKRSMCQITDL